LIRELPPAELDRWRSDNHRELPGVVHVPMRELPGRLDELPRDRDVVVVCHHGVRSRQVAHYLVRLGYMAVWNLTGGMAAWADQVDPAMPRY
jgi:rhodanese-related sulfurtransferase